MACILKSWRGMTVDDLKVGDLLTFGGDDPFDEDIGIVLDILPHLHSGNTDVLVHWNDEQPGEQFHDDEQINDWLTRGILEVIGEAK